MVMKIKTVTARNHPIELLGELIQPEDEVPFLRLTIKGRKETIMEARVKPNLLTEVKWQGNAPREIVLENEKGSINMPAHVHMFRRLIVNGLLIRDDHALKGIEAGWKILSSEFLLAKDAFERRLIAKRNSGDGYNPRGDGPIVRLGNTRFGIGGTS